MEPIDVSGTIIAKSDQLNADDLLSGPITVEITGVRMTKEDQPLSVSISGGRQPWKPCKTMRRVLVHAWGADASKWIGRWLTLYREPTVKWAGGDVGGIRIAAMSHITSRVVISLAETKGKKVKHTVDVLTPPVTHMSAEEFQRACAAAVRGGWTREQVATAIGGRAADIAPEMRREYAAILAGSPPAPEATQEISEAPAAAQEEA